MTQLDVMYRFGVPPTEAVMMALGRIREVYGIRALALDQANRTLRIEYDATRLTEPSVHSLVRRSGLDIEARVSLIPPQPEPEPPAQPATP